MSLNMEAMLGKYSSAGLRVLPLEPRLKVPAISRFQNLASTDLQVVLGWFREDPTRNVGLLMGGGLFVLDVDAGRGGSDSLRRLLGARKFPATWEAQTGGGGRHYLFRAPRAVHTKVNIWDGIDVIGEGCYIVAEPSLHPDTGREYIWVRLPRSGPASWPGWLSKALQRKGLVGDPPGVPRDRGLRAYPRRPGDVGFLADDLIARFPVLVPGTRNDTESA